MRHKIGIILLSLTISAASQPAQGKAIKLGTLAPQGSPWYQILRDLGEGWKEASDGEVQLRIYPGGVAGDEPDMVRKLRIGQLHAAALSGAGLARIAPQIQALQMPMMFASDAELDYVRQRIGGKLEAILEAKGFKVLAWGDAGWVYFFAQEPVVSPEDLKDLRLFTWAGSSAVVEAYKEAGYRPVPLAATDIQMALHSGMINAFPTTPIAALSFQWFAQAKHMTDLKWAPLVGAVVMSMRTWRTIPDGYKPRFVEIARRAGTRMQRTVRRLSAEAIEVMKKHGLVVHPVPERLKAQWERSARLGYSKLVGTVVPADMVAEVERLRDDYRTLSPGR